MILMLLLGAIWQFYESFTSRRADYANPNPHCGKPIVISGLSRKRLNIPLKKSVSRYRDTVAWSRQLLSLVAVAHISLAS